MNEKKPQTQNTNDNKNSPERKDYLSIFARDDFFVFLYKKTEKLVSVLFVISNFFSPGEPMQKEIRQISLQLLSSVVSYTTLPELRGRYFNETVRTLLEIVSLCEIFLRSGLLSEMNCVILRRECEYLLTLLEKHEKPFHKQDFLISDHLFKVSDTLLRQLSPVLEDNRQAENGRDFGTYDEMIEAQALAKESKGHLIKDSKMENDVLNKNLKRKRDFYGKPGIESGRRVDRQKAITNLLKRQQNASIKDFVSFIRGCSEKTIQRELQILVAGGVLKREGERRWSRYSLV